MQCALCRAFLPLPTYFLLWSSSTFSRSTPTLGLCRSYNYHIIILAINHHSIKVSYLFYLSINKLIDDPTINPTNKSTIKSNEKLKQKKKIKIIQVSLSRMVIDILKFTFLYLLVLFSFSCGELQYYIVCCGQLLLSKLSSCIFSLWSWLWNSWQIQTSELLKQVSCVGQSAS